MSYREQEQLAGDWVEAWESAAEAVNRGLAEMFLRLGPPTIACPVCDGDPDCHQLGCQPACA